jgi:hypothetical protein
MGRGVAAAFGLRPQVPVLEWREAQPGRRLAVVPHPSGRNLWYNDPANRVAVRDFVDAEVLRLSACEGPPASPSVAA